MTTDDARKRRIKEAVAADPLTAYQRCGLSGDGRRSNDHLTFPSPWRPEKTPSLTLYPDGTWCDFGEATDNGKRAGGDIFSFVKRLHGTAAFPEQVAFVAERLGIAEPPTPTRKPERAKTTEWDIRSETGEYIATHVRYDLSDGTKDLKWRRGDIWNLGGLNPDTFPLYGTAELLALDRPCTVVVVEGEKARDAAHAAGLIAVGTYGTSSTPTEDVLLRLVGHTVELWPDADPETDDPATSRGGQRHMARIAKVLAGLGQPCSIIEWHDAPPKGDAADFFAAHTLADFEQLARTPYQEEPARRAPSRKIISTDYSEIAKVVGEITWLWPDWLPNGCVVVAGGEEGMGKSAWALRCAMAVMQGENWPDGQSGPQRPRPVIWLDGEGVDAQTCDRIRRWNIDGRMLRTLGLADERFTHYIDEAQTQEAIEALALEIDAGLIVVDSLSACTKTDENKPAMKEPLIAWQRMAARLNIPVLILHHCRKLLMLEAPEFTTQRLRGSTAISQICRVVIGLDKPDPQKLDTRARVCKMSFGPGRPEVGFIETDEGLEFGEAPSLPQDASALMAGADWLKAYLANGAVAAKSGAKAAREAGIAARTLERVRPKVARCFKVGKEWFWGLKDAEVQ